MTITALTAILAAASGCAIGTILALIGGGGSILAVPLLVYLVGVGEPHVAIGTAAIAVALNAALGLGVHAQRGTVLWRCGLIFAASGSAGSAIGAAIGKSVDGRRLLALFGVLMIGVGLNMLHPLLKPAAAPRTPEQIPALELTLRLLAVGFGVGLLAGFFGIGGGFLIVPGLMFAAGMPIATAIGTSLVGVTAFGLTTAASYAVSGLVDWPLATILVLGGLAGSQFGARLNSKLGRDIKTLTQVFAGLIMVVGAAVVVKGLPALIGAG
jgi:uncharacterized protein